MKTVQVLGKDVRVPITADDWELYTTDDDIRSASETAAAALNAQLEKELERWVEMSHTGEFAPTRVAICAAMERFYPIMQVHAAAGAQDTEPRSLLELVLTRIALALGADVRL